MLVMVTAITAIDLKIRVLMANLSNRLRMILSRPYRHAISGPWPEQNLPIAWRPCRLSEGHRTRICARTELLRTSKMVESECDAVAAG
jgi:hypothetical protein